MNTGVCGHLLTLITSLKWHWSAHVYTLFLSVCRWIFCISPMLHYSHTVLVVLLVFWLRSILSRRVNHPEGLIFTTLLLFSPGCYWRGHKVLVPLDQVSRGNLCYSLHSFLYLFFYWPIPALLLLIAVLRAPTQRLFQNVQLSLDQFSFQKLPPVFPHKNKKDIFNILIECLVFNQSFLWYLAVFSPLFECSGWKCYETFLFPHCSKPLY